MHVYTHYNTHIHTHTHTHTRTHRSAQENIKSLIEAGAKRKMSSITYSGNKCLKHRTAWEPAEEGTLKL